MSADHAAIMLAAWESAGEQASVARALTLLTAACPERSREQWMRVPIGERDRQLLALRERLFGTQLDALAVCPVCAEQLELNFETGQITVAADDARTSVDVEAEGYALTCRTPDSADLLAAGAVPAEQARTLLLERCITSARYHGAPVAASDLPQTVREELEQALAQADPQAAVSIAVDCPACAHAWAIDFDVLTYLWSEIDDWAARTLREVHDLASAYGWSERAILAMSAARRNWYLDIIAGQR